MCMSTIGTRSRATVGNMSRSKVPPDTSFTMSAPARTAASATAACRVSIETAVSRHRSRRARMTGTVRRICSSTSISVAPGLVDSPPMSMMVAPSSTISRARATDRSTPSSPSLHFPPSLKESGVTLSIPMTRVRSKSRNRFRGSGTMRTAPGSFSSALPGLEPTRLSRRSPRDRFSEESLVEVVPIVGWTKFLPATSIRGARTNSRSARLRCGITSSGVSTITGVGVDLDSDSDSAWSALLLLLLLLS
mmetsp:Transcript_1919/g.5096  ORF Transcript_1919/g.5096 Transcript_1919/m.5096 type:complete len:249 (+) Transcript_1919:1759-2505(+)